MPLRPYSPADSLALATIKATCDLTDPLALYCRHINPDLHHQHHQHQQTTPKGRKIGGEGEKQWKAHVKSLQRSFELEVLLPGCVCWVVYADNRQQQHNNQDGNDVDGADGEEVVGFAIWNRHGTSPAAQKWRCQGQRVSTRTPPSPQKHRHTYMHANTSKRPKNIHKLCDYDTHIPLRPQHKPRPHEQLPTPHPLRTIPFPFWAETYLTKRKMGIRGTIHYAAVSTKGLRNGSSQLGGWSGEGGKGGGLGLEFGCR